jgi:UDP-N-acetylmuramoyl-tripeptide--D-alanyl-D-alanine ligase
MYLLHQLKQTVCGGSLLQYYNFISFNYYNASNLYAITRYFEVDENSIKEALESYIPENNRSQPLTKGSNGLF